MAQLLVASIVHGPEVTVQAIAPEGDCVGGCVGACVGGCVGGCVGAGVGVGPPQLTQLLGKSLLLHEQLPGYPALLSWQVGLHDAIGAEQPCEEDGTQSFMKGQQNSPDLHCAL